MPILALIPVVQWLLGIVLDVPFGDGALLVLSTIVYDYRGKPALKGWAGELQVRFSGMMTLIGLAIRVAYFSCAASVHCREDRSAVGAPHRREHRGDGGERRLKVSQALDLRNLPVRGGEVSRLPWTGGPT
jgi:hypothetical protein